jgi:hypothetical protein
VAKDILHTRFAQPIHDFFLHAAMGNDTSVTLKTLSLDGTKLTISADVRSRDVVKVHVPFNGHKTIVVYDVTANVSLTEDLQNPNPNLTVTFEGPHGIKIKVNVSGLIETLIGVGILAA